MMRSYIALVALLFVTLGFAGPHPLSNDPYKFKLGHDLREYAGKSTMLELMKKEIKPELEGIADRGEEGSASVGPAKNRNGVAVKINDENFFYHIGYPAGELGGRSYGLKKGQAVGDWTDRKYLDEMSRVARTSDSELGAFYKSLVEIIGACNPGSYSRMNQAHTQLVATNFLAIYGAEQYRAEFGSSEWDDALFQVSMVAAFHGGQKTLTKFYRGKFSNKSIPQQQCKYRSGGSATKDAALNDYWQKGVNCDRSGIHITRRDYEKMGQAITSFYKSNNTDNTQNFKRLQSAIRDSGSNVISDVAEYFIQKQSDDIGSVDSIASAVADFLVGLRKDADKITESLL